MILETKLNLPQPKTNTLLRGDLLVLLKNNLDKKLILITGDAGYGKTTLLAQLVKEARIPSMFYDLDKSDSDLPVFYSYLVNGIKQIDPSLVKYSEELLKQGGEAGKNVELLFGTLLNELCEKRKEELFIILDNYHTLTEDSIVHTAMDFFIDRLPEKIHVIISSRSAPSLPSLARWRSKQVLFDITRADLAFTVDEVASLIKDAGGEVSPEEDVRLVMARTEGWITGIRLIMQSVVNGKTTVGESLPRITVRGKLQQMEAESGGGGLFEYFASEVLSMESPEIQDFLTKCSILDTMTHQACNALLAIGNSEHLLNRLEKQCLFVSAIGAGEYRYHLLFREFLQSRIADGEMVKALHLKAGDHYKQKADIAQAIRHYLKAGSYGLAGGLIAEAEDIMVEEARFTTLEAWLEQIPENFICIQPRLLFIQGLLQKQQGKLHESERLFMQAESLLKKGADAVGLAKVLLERGRTLWCGQNYKEALNLFKKALASCPDKEKKLRFEILNMMGLTWPGLGDFKKANEYLAKAKRAAELMRDKKRLIIAEHNLVHVFYSQGELRSVIKLLEAICERLQDDYWLEIGTIFAGAARVALEAGETERAECLINKGYLLCKPYKDVRSQAELDLSLGSLCLERNQWVPAGQYLESARRAFEKMQLERAEISSLLQICRLYRWQRDFPKAEQYLNAARGKMTDNPKTLLYMKCLKEEGLLRIALGKFEQAEQAIKLCLRVSNKSGYKMGEFLGLFAYAALYLAKSGKNEAVRFLCRAVRLSQRNGYDGILIGELRQNPGLLELAQKCAASGKKAKGIDMDDIRRALSKSETRPPGAGAKPLIKVRLLGCLEISLESGKVAPVKWSTRKEASLFAYLLLHRNRLCEKEELIKNLWPRANLAQGEQDLRTTVCRLKKNLKNGLFSTGESALAQTRLVIHQERGYRLAPDVFFWVDAEEFFSQWQATKEPPKDADLAKAYNLCLELYRDKFLVNLVEHWCEQRRERYEKMFLHILKNLAERRVQNKDYDEAIVLYRRHLEIDFYPEETHISLWRVLRAVGRKIEIKNDYKELCGILKKYLGANPEPETQKAYQELIS